MTLHGFRFFSAAVAFSLLLLQSTSASITLRSGNGPKPGNDSLVSMLVGPADSPFPGAITPADFAAARGGPSAFIVSPINSLWKPHLALDPAAEWISTNANGASGGSTALYAIDFTIASSSILNATLNIDFLIDNELGDAVNEGLFVNTTPLSGSKLLGVLLSNFQVDNSFPTFDITSLVNPGVNTLYINAVDRGGPSALQLSATVDVQGDGVIPEPSTLLIWSLLVAVGISVGGRRQKKAA